MKFIAPQLTYLLNERESRRNLKFLGQFLVFLAAVVGAFSVLFHVIMVYEGQQHSWLTGVYWTLTVMSTLGFGDITFHSDVGRLFSVVVLVVGIFLLLIVLPFAFIRFFYAPWLDARMRLGAPREVPLNTRHHVILCHWDEVGRGLYERLEDQGVTVFVVESDPVKANDMKRDGLRVVCGDLDSKEFFQALHVSEASLVVANLSDPVNTNIVLTVREEAPNVRVAALAEELDSVDILELSGATEVLPLKQRLGEQLASRVTVGTPRPQIVGRLGDLCVAEFPVHGTPFAGKTIQDSGLRRLTGLSAVSVWDRGRAQPARADTVMGDYAVLVVVGQEHQVIELEAMLCIYESNDNPVVVVGGGKVGRAVARALKRRDIIVHMVERDKDLEPILSQVADRMYSGDASAIDIVTAAGVKEAPAVVLTTNDDAINIFLAVYCRRLNPEARIISRITHERNMEAVHRAGADFALGYNEIGTKYLNAIYHGRETVVVVVGLDLYSIQVPECLHDKTLAEAAIGARTGLNVAAIQQEDGSTRTVNADTRLQVGTSLVVLGTPQQRHEFDEIYDKTARHSRSSQRGSAA